jgi:hypothetical protein
MIINFDAMKRFLPALIFILLLNVVNAQVGLGLRAGYGLTKLSSTPFLSYESNPHTSKWVPQPTAGLIMDVVVSDIFFIQLEALYSGFAAEYDLLPSNASENPEGQPATLNQSFHQIQFPIVAKFATYDTKVTSYLEFGFNTSVFLSGEYKIEDPNTGSEKSGDFNFNHMKKADFGFVIGVGFGTDFGKRSSWALNLRYIHGVSDLNEIQEDANPEYVSNQTRQLTLSLILMIL